jgi:hypothetical protein
MNPTIKKALTFTVIALVVVSISAVASAKKKQGPMWYNGTVTKAAWTEGKDTFIEVDSERYIFLSGDRVKVTRQYRAANGQWNSEALPLNRIYTGTKVLFKAEARHLHELVVKEP